MPEVFWSGLENNTKYASNAKRTDESQHIARYISTASKPIVCAHGPDSAGMNGGLSYIFRTKHIPGSARISSRISRASSALVS